MQTPIIRGQAAIMCTGNTVCIMTKRAGADKKIAACKHVHRKVQGVVWHRVQAPIIRVQPAIICTESTVCSMRKRAGADNKGVAC